MKILVVDDERTLVKGIKFNLENEGYQVDCGYDGEEAVSLAKTGGYDLMILDLMMPKKDGLQACQEIRMFSTVPIIILTARSEDADKLMGFESGADDYITKPFNIMELKARIRALLRRASIASPQEGGDGGRLVRGHIAVDTEKRRAENEIHSLILLLSVMWIGKPNAFYSQTNSLRSRIAFPVFISKYFITAILSPVFQICS